MREGGNMAQLFLLFSHQLTKNQEMDAKELGIKSFISMPPPLKDIWSSIPPKLKGLNPLLEPIRDWLLKTAEVGDYLLIQGDFGATYLMVDWSLKRGFRPIYATTQRRVVEELGEDGVMMKKSWFVHVQFRSYGV